MRTTILITTLLLLSACSSKSDDTATFADPQIQAYDKAQEVQGIVDTAGQQQQQQMQEEGL